MEKIIIMQFNWLIKVILTNAVKANYNLSSVLRFQHKVCETNLM